MVVPPRSSHSTGIDVVGHDIAVITERLVAKGAYAILGDYLAIKKLSHFAVGAKFPVSPRVLRVLDAANAHLALASFSLDSLPATAGHGAMKRA